MNVLLIFPHGNALNPRTGGETRIWLQSKWLIEHNFNLTILHSSNSKGFEDKNLKNKCKIYYYRELYGSFEWFFTDLNPLFLLKLHKIIRKEKIEIIQVEWPWGILSAKLLKKKKQFLIYNEHGVEAEFIKISVKNPEFPNFLGPIAQIYTRFYERIACKFSDVIINVSELDRKYYINEYNIKRSKTIVIQTPSGLNITERLRTEELKHQSRKKLDLPPDKTIIIFHGSFPHPPNVESFDLIEKVIAPQIMNPDILFVLAGNNTEKYRKKNIISLGFIDDLLDLLYSADFAIVPVISGSGMRVKCADYIAVALPFITTTKGIEGIEFLKSNEDYLESNDVDDDFIEYIITLANDINLQHKFSKNLIKKRIGIDQKTSKNRFIKLYLKLLEKF